MRARPRVWPPYPPAGRPRHRAIDATRTRESLKTASMGLDVNVEQADGLARVAQRPAAVGPLIVERRRHADRRPSVGSR
jgi:hypothetical protein